MSMRTVYLSLYIALAFVAGAVLLNTSEAFAYQSPYLHTVIPTVLSTAQASTETSTPVAAPVQNSELSQNWAGYVADSGGQYTAVGASWTIPAVSASNGRLSTDATWVGIGGVKTQDLIQAGTQAVTQNGQTSYQAWYEALPGYQQIAPLSVSAGDSVTVSLAQGQGENWTISFADETTGKSYQATIQYNSSLSSADWIEEMPVEENSAGQMSYLPLDNFGTVTFSGAYTVVGGQGETLQASGAQPLTMSLGRQVLATPTVLADNGSFSVTRSDNTTSSVSGMQAASSYNPRAFRRHEFSSGSGIPISVTSNGNNPNMSEQSLPGGGFMITFSF